MHVFDITLKCIIVSWFLTQQYNLLQTCCLIQLPAQPACLTFEFRQTQIMVCTDCLACYCMPKIECNLVFFTLPPFASYLKRKVWL